MPCPVADAAEPLSQPSHEAKMTVKMTPETYSGVAVVVIEHHMDLIMAVADRIVVIDQGRKLAEGTPAEVQHNEAVREAYPGRAA